MISALSAPVSSNRSWPVLPDLVGSPGKRRRICIASFDFVGPVKNGGVGTAFTSLGEALAAAGHDVTLLFLAGKWCENKTLEHWIEHYRRKGIRFLPLPESGLNLNSRWHVNKAYEGYLWLKQQPAFDVIHFSEWKGPGYFAMRAKRQGLAFADTLMCIHTHGPTLWHKLSNGEYVTQADDVELDYLERSSVRLADVVVSPSQYLLRWMVDRGWTLPERTYVQQYVRPATARQPKPDADRVHVINELVFFGRLEIRKGLVLFCDALDRLSQDPRFATKRVSFLGKSDRVHGRESQEYLAERAKSWPWKIEVISDRDQMGAMDYLQGEGRLAVIPSLVDNLPNTVLECLGAQVPFLASDAGGIPEMIAPDDLAATCFPLRAPAFAARLARAWQEGVRPARYAVEQKANERAWSAWHEGLAAPVAVPAFDLDASPLVSICMSHWNRPAYLRQALASIEAQDYRNFEVVLIDDGSTQPEAHALLAELEPQFAARGWRLLRNAENRYPGAARNRAVRETRGEYILFMDDDNCAKPNALSTFVRVALRTGADIVTCCLDTFSGHAQPHANLKPTNRWLFLGDDLGTGALRNNFGDTNGLWRREVFVAVGGFHEEWGVGHEDWEVLARAVLAGYSLETVPEPLAWYRLNETEATVNRKTPVHANHQANIRPYLQAVHPDLRALVQFAQGMYLKRVQSIEMEAIAQLAHYGVLWKSKLEAALVLIEMRQEKAAVRLMIEGVKAVEGCRNLKVIIEAIAGIAPHLGRFEPGKARFLLEKALPLAEKAGYPALQESVQASLTKLGSGKTASLPKPSPVAPRLAVSEVAL